MRRYALSAAASIGLVVLLLLLVSFESPATREPSARIALRDTQIAVPPPPAPPPIETSSRDSRPEVEIEIDRPRQTASLLANLDVSVDIPAALIAGHQIGTGLGDGAAGFDVRWDGFSLPYLDSMPSVVAAPAIEYPKELLERGVRAMDVSVLIQVDEEGNTTLLEIISTPYPPFNEDLREFVSAVRFTAPTVGGESVKAVYVWPLGINAP